MFSHTCSASYCTLISLLHIHFFHILPWWTTMTVRFTSKGSRRPVMAPVSTTLSDAPTNEKGDIKQRRIPQSSPTKPKKDLSGKFQKVMQDDIPSDDLAAEQAAKPEQQRSPSSFLSLQVSVFPIFCRIRTDSHTHFLPRFATRLEIFLDVVGLFCAAAAGAAQVRISDEHPLPSES